MRFCETPLGGLFLIEPEFVDDDRGGFARSFCRDDFARHGVSFEISQINISTNHAKGTLRGLHYQAAPYEEAKIIRCIRGAVYDVAVDLRADSPTRLRWHAVELSGDNYRMFYLPQGFAHGFITLTENAELLYLMSAPYVVEAARGVRWDDPKLAITWPFRPVVLSDRDGSFPSL